jgi:F-type H+-transporting ATPase subunit b
MLAINGTLFVQLINFIVFLAILNVIFMKPVGAAIARRRAYIDGLTGDVEQLQTDVKELHAQADQRRLDARRAAEESLAQARAQAAKESDAQIVAAQERAGEIVAKAHAQVATEIAAARADESRVVATLADEMVSRALGSLA